MTLWVFGHSVCRAHDLDNDQLGWPYLVSKALNCDLQNFAREAADNFYIFSSYLENRINIKPTDVVIVGWSHPSRKSFVLDLTNPNHKAAVSQSLVYQLNNVQLIRSYNTDQPVDYPHWSKLKPSETGKKFYDTWFRDYYAEYEQMVNLQSYCDSVKSTCVAPYLPFFFSKESVQGLDVDGVGFILEFIHEHKVAISQDNMHLNAQGHLLWANHLISQLQ